MTDCAGCGAPQAPIWIALPADRPTLPACPACGRTQPVIGWWPTLPAWVLIAPRDRVAAWRSWEQQVERRFWRAVARHPDWLSAPNACRRRIVFGHAALHEKQLIWQHALDDAIVECLKLDVRLRVPRLRAHPEADLRLCAINVETLGFASSTSAGVWVPRRRYDELVADAAALAHRWPALFQRPFVDHLRLRPRPSD